MTDIRKEIIKNNNLAQKAREIHLQSVINIPSTSNQKQITDSVVADMLEALIGVVYLEQGLGKCKEVVYELLDLENISLDEYIQKSLDSEISILENKNPISALQEFLAKKGISPPDYSPGIAIGNSQFPCWNVEANCVIGEKRLISEGQGKRKQQAKAEAAKNLLPQVVDYTKNLRIY